MPYILKHQREKFQSAIKELAKLINDDTNGVPYKSRAGNLNYIITKLLLEVYKKDECYLTHNEIIGMLHCCAEEWYRRRVAPYEDTKINNELNGDVFPDED